MKIRKRVLGEEHPNLVRSMANLVRSMANLVRSMANLVRSMANLVSTYQNQGWTGQWKEVKVLGVLVMGAWQ